MLPACFFAFVCVIDYYYWLDSSAVGLFRLVFLLFAWRRGCAALREGFLRVAVVVLVGVNGSREFFWLFWLAGIVLTACRVYVVRNELVCVGFRRQN